MVVTRSMSRTTQKADTKYEYRAIKKTTGLRDQEKKMFEAIGLDGKDKKTFVKAVERAACYDYMRQYLEYHPELREPLNRFDDEKMEFAGKYAWARLTDDERAHYLEISLKNFEPLRLFMRGERGLNLGHLGRQIGIF